MNYKKTGIFCFGLMMILLTSAFGQGSFYTQMEDLTPSSKASILMEYETGEVLNEQNSLEQLPIASVTKLMTILLTMENLENGNLTLEQKITASENASSMGGSQVFIDANAEYQVKNLLKAVIVASANDASVALAEEIAGSEEVFVEQMNQKAKELKLENTNYVNCTGLPAPSQYSCAKDVAVIMREILNYPLYFEISKIWIEDFEHPSGRVTGMANTNKLVRFYNGCDAGKTGSTNEAGFCLCATAKRNGIRLISVVLGSPSSKERFKDASTQFDWGFKNFESVKLVSTENNLAENVKLEKAKEDNLIISAEEDFCKVVKRGNKPNYDVTIELPKKLQAPLKMGDAVGKIIVTEDGEVKKEINIIVKENVQSKNYFETTKTILKDW